MCGLTSGISGEFPRALLRSELFGSAYVLGPFSGRNAGDDAVEVLLFSLEFLLLSLEPPELADGSLCLIRESGLDVTTRKSQGVGGCWFAGTARAPTRYCSGWP